MPKRRRIQAVFAISKSIPQFMADGAALKTALTKARATKYVTIAPAYITALENNLAQLAVKQAIVAKRKQGSRAVRDIVLSDVIRKVRHLVRIVQQAMDEAADITEAVAIAQSCGIKVRKPRVLTIPDTEVRKDEKHEGLVHLISKAKHKRDNARYIWEVSSNKRTFTRIKVTHKSRTTWQTDVAPGTKLFFRKGIISRRTKEELVWSQTIAFVVT